MSVSVYVRVFAGKGYSSSSVLDMIVDKDWECAMALGRDGPGIFIGDSPSVAVSESEGTERTSTSMDPEAEVTFLFVGFTSLLASSLPLSLFFRLSLTGVFVSFTFASGDFDEVAVDVGWEKKAESLDCPTSAFFDFFALVGVVSLFALTLPGAEDGVDAGSFDAVLGVKGEDRSEIDVCFRLRGRERDEA